jgi:hypothetical protein
MATQKANLRDMIWGLASCDTTGIQGVREGKPSGEMVWVDSLAT